MGVERVLGRISGSQTGPTLICVGGLHGNEPAGVSALQRILASLGPRSSDLQGEFLAVAGNRAALAKGRRYISRDLNRSWTPERLSSLRRIGPEAPVEDREQLELQGVLDEALERARGPVLLLDLHTTSGPGVPFSAIKETVANRNFALAWPVPLVLGFGELMEGTFFGYLTERGITSMVFEGGPHQDPSSVDASEEAVWLGLAESGILREVDFPEVAQARASLASRAREFPPVLEIRHRHPVISGDGFRMRPGFENFQPVSAGELLAHDHLGDIKSPKRGLLLLPLYQKQGDDGFFVIQQAQGRE
jgi:predicted deacylase